MSFKANNSVNFQPIFINEMSNFKLWFFPSTSVQCVDSFNFRAEPFFSKLVHIFFLGYPVRKSTLTNDLDFFEKQLWYPGVYVY